MKLNTRCFWGLLKGAVKVHITEGDLCFCFFFFEMPATHPCFLNFKISFACHSSVASVLSDLPCTLRLGNKNVHLQAEEEMNPLSTWNPKLSLKSLCSLRQLTKLVQQHHLFCKNPISSSQQRLPVGSWNTGGFYWRQNIMTQVLCWIKAWIINQPRLTQSTMDQVCF